MGNRSADPSVKKQNPPRRHGDTEKIKTNIHHRRHKGARRRTETKSLPQRSHRPSNKIKLCRFMKVVTGHDFKARSFIGPCGTTESRALLQIYFRDTL